MKTHLALATLTAFGFCSCASSVTQSPLSTPQPRRTKPVEHSAQPSGALRQVSPKPAVSKPKAFPDIPLKEDTGVSPLIHNSPDTPSYKRSTP